MEVVYKTPHDESTTLGDMDVGVPFKFDMQHDIDDLEGPFIKVDVGDLSKMKGKKAMKAHLEHEEKSAVVGLSSGCIRVHVDECIVVPLKAKLVVGDDE